MPSLSLRTYDIDFSSPAVPPVDESSAYRPSFPSLPVVSSLPLIVKPLRGQRKSPPSSLTTFSPTTSSASMCLPSTNHTPHFHPSISYSVSTPSPSLLPPLSALPPTAAPPAIIRRRTMTSAEDLSHSSPSRVKPWFSSSVDGPRVVKNCPRLFQDQARLIEDCSRSPQDVPRFTPNCLRLKEDLPQAFQESSRQSRDCSRVSQATPSSTLPRNFHRPIPLYDHEGIPFIDEEAPRESSRRATDLQIEPSVCYKVNTLPKRTKPEDPAVPSRIEPSLGKSKPTRSLLCLVKEEHIVEVPEVRDSRSISDASLNRGLSRPPLGDKNVTEEQVNEVKEQAKSTRLPSWKSSNISHSREDSHISVDSGFDLESGETREWQGDETFDGLDAEFDWDEGKSTER